MLGHFFSGRVGTDYIYDIAVAGQFVYVTGHAHSKQRFPVTAPGGQQPFQVIFGGQNPDAFFAKIDHTTTPPSFEFITRLGGGRQVWNPDTGDIQLSPSDSPLSHARSTVPLPPNLPSFAWPTAINEPHHFP